LPLPWAFSSVLVQEAGVWTARTGDALLSFTDALVDRAS